MDQMPGGGGGGIKPQAVLVGLGAVGLVIGALLPWVTVTAAFVGTISVAGTEGDGVITLLFGLAIALMSWPLLSRGKLPLWAAITVLALGALATLTCLYDIVNVSNKIDDLPDGVATASVGIGLWLSAIAALAVFGGGILEMVAKRPSPATTPFQAPMYAPPPPPPPTTTPPPPPPPPPPPLGNQTPF